MYPPLATSVPGGRDPSRLPRGTTLALEAINTPRQGVPPRRRARRNRSAAVLQRRVPVHHVVMHLELVRYREDDVVIV